MEWEEYKIRFINQATFNGLDQNRIDELLCYSHCLMENGLPVIIDSTHLSELIGIDNAYLHAISNSSKHFYRSFRIPKHNGSKRIIDEPLPDLKIIQKWILKEILYKIPCSKFAKAYVPHTSVKDNARFHRNQEIVVSVDIRNFFPSVKSDAVYKLFLQIGYNKEVSVLLTKLCCYNGRLPQGAPTSPYLSNLILKEFDEIISTYCVDNNIRYTRYADDMTFSGNFDIRKLTYLIDGELWKCHLKQNKSKFKVMRQSRRQVTTNIVVNRKTQLTKEYRNAIRQEIYYINKFGLESHLKHIGEKRKNYLPHLLGKIDYALFINPKDEKMSAYRETIKKLM